MLQDSIFNLESVCTNAQAIAHHAPELLAMDVFKDTFSLMENARHVILDVNLVSINGDVANVLMHII